MTKHRTVLCQALAAAMGLSVAVFLVLLLDRRPVIILNPNASHVVPNPAISGETIGIVWAAKAERFCSGVVHPRIIDSTGRLYQFAPAPVMYQDVMTLKDTTFTKWMVLPKVMAPGRARYEAVVLRWCNPVQQYIWPMIDTPSPVYFEIAK